MYDSLLKELEGALKDYYSKKGQNGSYNCLLSPLKKANKVLAEEGIPLLEVLDIEKPVISKKNLKKLEKLAIEARNRIWEDNLNLIGFIAKKYRKVFPDAEYQDLKLEGNFGFLKAIKNYNPHKGVPFPIFAMFTIEDHLKKSIPEYLRIVKLPINFLHDYKKFEHSLNRFKEKFNHSPSDEELATFMNKTTKYIRNIRQCKECFYHVWSLNHSFPNEPREEIVDKVIDKNSKFEDKIIEKITLSGFLKKNLPNLSDIEKNVLLGRLKFKTLEEIGMEYNVPRESIRQIELRVINKLNFEEYI